MSIELITENNTAADGLFMPPVVREVKRRGKSPLGIVTLCVLVLAAVGLAVCDFTAGVFLLPVCFALLVSGIVGFVRSGNGRGDFGLKFQTAVYLVSAVIMALFIALRRIDYTASLLSKLSEPFKSFTDTLPKPFNDTINRGFDGAEAVSFALAVCFLCMALSFGALARAKRKNLPFAKCHFIVFLVQLGSAAWIVYLGFRELLSTSSELTGYINAALYFAFSVCLLLQAVRLLITFIKLRKVSNAVFKAKI